MQIKNFIHYPGKCCGVTSILKFYNHAGLKNPFNSKPVSESLLYGLMGGIGFKFKKTDGISLNNVFRISGNNFNCHLEELLFDFKNIIPVNFTSLKDKMIFREAFQYYLEFGQPLVMNTRIHSLVPYINVPFASNDNIYYSFVIYGIDGDNLLISDICNEPLKVNVDNFIAGRTLYGKPYAFYNFENNDYSDIGENSFRELVKNQLVQNIELNSSIFNSENSILCSWKDVFNNTLLNLSQFESSEVLDALINLYLQIKYSFSSLVNSRSLFAGFLEESSIIMEDELLLEASNEFNNVSLEWKNLADCIFPDQLDFARDLRNKIDSLQVNWMQNGLKDKSLMMDSWTEIEMLKNSMDIKSMTDFSEWQNNIVTEISTIHQTEVEVFHALSDLLDL